MKILFVSTLYVPNAVGGAEATVKLLAEGVVRNGGEAVVVTLSPDRSSAERIVEGVHVHYVPLFNVFFPHGAGRRPVWLKPLWHFVEACNPVMARRLRRVIRREAPDVVNIHNLQGFSCAIWPMLAGLGIPTVQTLHDHYTACVNSVMYRQGRNCSRRCLRCRMLCAPRRVLSRHVGVVTAVSRRLLSRIEGFGLFPYAIDKRVIHGCNTDVVLPLGRTLPAPGEPVRLGFLGRLEPIKGLELLLTAAERIGQQHIRVCVGGVGPLAYEAALKSRFACAQIEFLGRVAPSDFFAGIDALVVPSIVEDALPRVIHEAMGFGVPVIGAAIGGIPEMIREGKTGFLFPAGDGTALEATLRRIVETPPDWAALSAACRDESQRFTFAHVFAEYWAAWTAAAQGPPTRAPATAFSGRAASPSDPLLGGRTGSP